MGVARKVAKKYIRRMDRDPGAGHQGTTVAAYNTLPDQVKSKFAGRATRKLADEKKIKVEEDGSLTFQGGRNINLPDAEEWMSKRSRKGKLRNAAIRRINSG